jgi:renierapurpurin 18,18'-hydroxylase
MAETGKLNSVVGNLHAHQAAADRQAQILRHGESIKGKRALRPRCIALRVGQFEPGGDGEEEAGVESMGDADQIAQIHGLGNPVHSDAEITPHAPFSPELWRFYRMRPELSFISVDIAPPIMVGCSLPAAWSGALATSMTESALGEYPHETFAMTVLAAQQADLRRVGAHPDYWYPLAWAPDLKRGKTLACHFAGEPVVLYRGQSGTVHALEDRCAHRQVPLSMGIVDGEELKCGYHGWTYDCAGKCVNIPYLGRERLPNGVTAYPVREVDGMIMIFPGEPSLAESRLPASLGSHANGDYKTRRLDRSVACHYSFMHENLFDMNHQLLHRSLMGSIKATCLGRKQGNDWCEVDYTFSRTEGRATLGESTILGIVRAPKDAANRDVMTIRTEYPYQRLKVWVDGGDPVLDVWLAYTPLDAAQRTNRTFGPSGVALRDLVHRRHLHPGQAHRGGRAESARPPGRRLEQRSLPAGARRARSPVALRRAPGAA